MYHSGQESKRILESIIRRDAELFERKRRAEFEQKKHLAEKERKVDRIPLDRDFILTTQIQLSDHATLLKMTPEDFERSDCITKIRQDLDVQFTFSDLSLQKLSDARRAVPYTSVSIKGSLSSVEAARARLQKIIPISVALPLDPPKMKKGFTYNGLCDIVKNLRANKDYYFPSITVAVGKGPCLSATEFGNKVEQRRSSSSQPLAPVRLYLTISGAAADSSKLIQCVKKYREFFYKKDEVARKPDAIVGILLDIPEQFRGYVVGKPEGILMRFLSTFSKTLIHFPSYADVRPSFPGATYEMPEKCRPTTYYISGKVENVIKCFLLFQQALPVSLSFNLEDKDLIEKVRTHPTNSEGDLLNHFDKTWNLHVLMNKNLVGGEQIHPHDCERYTGVITTTHANINRMYGYRRAIMVPAWKGPRVLANMPFNFDGEKPIRKYIADNTKHGFVYSLNPETSTRPVFSVCGL